MKSSERGRGQSGYTLVEVMVSIVVLGIVALSFFELFSSLIRSAILMKRKSVALTLATNQMEYLRSLPYNNLAVVGGGIIAASPLPVTTNKTVDGVKYTIRTSVNYLDDAFDGCGHYPTAELKAVYCRNYALATNNAMDLNPADYKSVNVKVSDVSGLVLSEVDTQIAARIAETNNNTGGMFVTVIDENGNPLQGATVRLVNTTTSPTVDISDATDQNGNAVFYSLPPDPSSYDYAITASLSNYSTLTTITPSGSLQPNFPNQKVVTQQSSLVTLQLKPQGANSLVVETTDTSGAPLGNVRTYIKGGYKRYSNAADTSYYYDNMTPSDSRLLTDANGMGVLSNLVPGDYIFCGDAGATNCRVGTTTYYLAAVVPYGGVRSLGPLAIPTYLSSDPPDQTFPYNSVNYLQKVRLMLTTSNTFPRVFALAPYTASRGTSTINDFDFSITGANLPCSNNAASCQTTVRLKQGLNTYTASCTGSNAGVQLNCSINMTGVVDGGTQLEIVANSQTLTLPAAPLLGGITIEP